MRLYSSVWQWRLALVAMKLTQQAHKYTRMKEEADVGSGACGQENVDNDELCRKFSCWRRVGTCASPTTKTKRKLKTVPGPVKPLQVRFLEPRAPRSVYVPYSTPPFRLLLHFDSPSHSRATSTTYAYCCCYTPSTTDTGILQYIDNMQRVDYEA